MRTRLRPVLLSVLAPLLAVAPLALPSYAGSRGPDGGSAHRAGPGAGTNSADSIIRGLVTDRAGHFLDDVLVEAVAPSGEVVASALSYASLKAHGPQHGFYGLHVPAGHYRLRLEKAGYTRRTIGDVTVGRHAVEVVDTASLAQPRGRTRTVARVLGGPVGAGGRARVAVAVSGPHGGGPVTGAVVVTEGSREVGTARLAARDHGRVTVRLDRLPPGRHQLRAAFEGAASLRASRSGAVQVRVQKAHGHR